MDGLAFLIKETSKHFAKEEACEACDGGKDLPNGFKCARCGTKRNKIGEIVKWRTRDS